MVADQQELKITYTTMSVAQAEAFHASFDQALETVHQQLGREYPIYIGGKSRSAQGRTFEDRSPNDIRLLLGTFPECGQVEARDAVNAASSAFPVWSRVSWPDRLTVMRRAADNLRQRKYEIAAWLSVEVGKPRVEAMGEVEEAADLITWYCDQMEAHRGFVIQLNQLSPTEHNQSVLRPYGVWLVVSPFNFPVALTTGMVAGALIAGNTVVFKPSEDAPLSGAKVYECLTDAGLPEGALNFVTGRGNEIGEMLSSSQGIDGIVFTGSRAIGTKVYREFSAERPRPCIAEMGGKNPVIITQSADLQKAVEGTVRAAFGYSGQKCSAASRVYAHASVVDEVVERLEARTQQLLVDDATKQESFMGPVINDRAYDRFKSVAARASRDGTIITGGRILDSDHLSNGYYCAPTVALLPAHHDFFRDELFVPFVAVATVHSLEQAIQLANDSEYGLTAGIFTEDREEQQTFLDRIEAGVVYVNRQSGATTGAWPGVQSFGGWKASGSTGKSALGPYYVQQFLREQSQTVVTD